MRRGFTILELLVASLLLGMLMTILTMIFSQSSIAWRTGIASVADMQDVREKVSIIRYEADNAYVNNGNVECVRSVFDDNGKLRTDGLIGAFPSGGPNGISTSVTPGSPQTSVGFSNSLSAQSGNAATYIVNVMSKGPDREIDTYDDIWSFPDDPNEW